MKTIMVFVAGYPKGQPRPRSSVYFSAKKQKHMSRVYDVGTAEEWKSRIAAELNQHLPESPVDGPVAVSARFVMPRPKKLLRKSDPDGTMTHTTKPDADNLIKAVMDVCSQIGVWRDDKQVADLLVQKRIASKAGRPGLHLVISELVESEGERE